MKRGPLVLALGLVAAVASYWCFYRWGTASSRSLMQSSQPELAWLKQEFHLDDREFARLAELHAGYLPQCRERCRRIEEVNRSLAQTLASATDVTPEIERLLAERSQLRAACQAGMLKHFYAVSRTMPAEQGKRYLTWVMDSTCLRETAMGHGSESPAEPSAHVYHP